MEKEELARYLEDHTPEEASEEFGVSLGYCYRVKREYHGEVEEYVEVRLSNEFLLSTAKSLRNPGRMSAAETIDILRALPSVLEETVKLRGIIEARQQAEKPSEIERLIVDAPSPESESINSKAWVFPKW